MVETLSNYLFKQYEKDPSKKLEKAEHSKNPTTRKRAVLAKTLNKIRS